MNPPLDAVISPPARFSRTIHFTQSDGSRAPYRVFSSQEVYDRLQRATHPLNERRLPPGRF